MVSPMLTTALNTAGMPLVSPVTISVIVLPMASTMPAAARPMASPNKRGSVANRKLRTVSGIDARNVGSVVVRKSTAEPNADVKAYAREMVSAHTALDKKGVQISGQTAATNAAMRDSVVNANKAMSSQLQSAASGAAFDRAYIDGQVMGHQNTLNFLQQAQNQAQNADLKQMITAAIPDVQQHLERARALQSKVGQ